MREGRPRRGTGPTTEAAHVLVVRVGRGGVEGSVVPTRPGWTGFGTGFGGTRPGDWDRTPRVHLALTHAPDTRPVVVLDHKDALALGLAPS